MGLGDVMLSGTLVFAALISEAAAAMPSRQAAATSGASPTVFADAVPTRVSAEAEMCEARTINYITHALPQSCLTSSWGMPTPTSNTLTDTHQSSIQISAFGNTELVSHPMATSSDLNVTETASTEVTMTTFMSFEDWKEMMLRRAGQDPHDLRTRRLSEHHTSDRYSAADIGHAGLGEEGEISLNFEHYSDGDEMSISTHKHGNDEGVEQQVANATPGQEDGKTATVHLSKDAGKTCKERFSYSSFDAGATILKTSPGAKNAKAILVENKDTYMLLECDTSSKYVIVELSDDISVDTVVLANFEFFSSMIRHFRVSVSDRYPVKMDKWRELGTFEARNSRDIQPFLVENPQIWAKYVRIEFLTHFGNEYYCPISLLRIHGSRMLDSWKDSEVNRDDEVVIPEDENGSHPVYNASENLGSAPPFEGQLMARVQNLTVWRWPFALNSSTTFDMTCPVVPSPAKKDSLGRASSRAAVDETASSDSGRHVGEIVSPGVASADAISQPGTLTDAAPDSVVTKSSIADARCQDEKMIAGGPCPNDTVCSTESTVISDRPHNNTTATSTKAMSSSEQSIKHRSSGTIGPPVASPTMQEGFFHAITKRLQQAESNLTLSMKYVEDQSKHVQETLHSREQKQKERIALFLDDLNKTVLSELGNLREQYDQIWQSTVLALESQRDRSEKDMMALSTRLNLLADEVVFQKRMAIVQAIILLSCLFLIIFSRGVSLPPLGPLLDQSPATAYPPSSLRHTSPRCNYQANKEIEEERCNAPRSRALGDYHQPRADPDRASGDSPFQFDDDGGNHDTTTASDGCSFYQHLSAYIPPSPLTEPDPPDEDGSAINYTNSRKVPAMYLNDIRKPLPSLPEHSPSYDGT